MNYCVDYSTYMYYELTYCKIEVQVNKVTSNCTLYKTQTKFILSTNFCHPSTKMSTNIRTSQIYVAAFIPMNFVHIYHKPVV